MTETAPNPRSTDAGRCAACGYSVAGLQSLRCPECGADLRATGIESQRRAWRCPLPKWGRRLGAAAFLFFLIKGLLWLIIPGLVVMGVISTGD